MQYPDPVRISAGMSASLDLIFRPVNDQIYQDKIEITSERGTFSVSVIALLPRPSLDVPRFLDFDFCAVNQTAHRSITITNDGQVPLSLKWSMSAPFGITPEKLELAPGESADMDVAFRPTV